MTRNEESKTLTQRVPIANLALSMSVLALLASPATAEEEPTAVFLDPVVVTPTRTEVEQLEVPAAVSVVTSEKIEKEGARSVVEALQGEPGVRVSYYTEGNFPIVQIRSSGDAGQFQNTDVLVLIDGIPQVNLNDQSYYDQIPFEAIDRIEVVRGPTSALYGRNAVGGTINVITKRAPSEREFSATGTVGSFGYVKPSLSIGGPIADNINLLVSGSFEQADGWRDQTEREAVDLFARADIFVTPEIDITLTGRYFDLEQETPTILPLLPDGSEVPGVDREDSFNLPGAESRNEVLQLAATLNYEPNEQLLFTVPIYYRHTDRILDRDGSFIDNVNTTAQTFDLYPFTPTSEESIIGIAPRATWTPTERVELVFGVDYEHNDAEAGASNTFPAGTNFFTPITVNYATGQFLTDINNLDTVVRRDGDFESTVMAAYAQGRIDVTDKLTLTLGGRYDRQERELVDPLRPNPRVEADYERFTPRAALNYAFADNLNAYVSYSEGFNPPFGGAFAFERAGAEELDPEVATNYEVGVKYAFPNGRGFLNAAGFYLERRDLVQTFRIDGINTQINAGGLDVFGLELNGAYNLGGGFTVSGNYSYTETEWQDYVVGGTDFAGFEVIQNPEHLASIALDWTSNDGRFSIGPFIDYVGERFADRANTVTLDDYTLVNLQASYKPLGNDRVTLRLQGLNLLDEEYLTRTELDFAGNVLGGSPGLPRSVLATVGLKF